MSRSRHTEAQMIAALKQVEAGRAVEDVAREVGVSKHTIYGWKAKYGGMDVSQAQEAKQLRDENTRLRKLVADLSLDKEALVQITDDQLFFPNTSTHLNTDQLFFEPVMCVRFGIKCLDFDISRASIEMDRLMQGSIGLQTKDLDACFASVPF
jgi:putative transposase